MPNFKFLSLTVQKYQKRRLPFTSHIYNILNADHKFIRGTEPSSVTLRQIIAIVKVDNRQTDSIITNLRSNRSTSSNLFFLATSVGRLWTDNLVAIAYKLDYRFNLSIPATKRTTICLNCVYNLHKIIETNDKHRT